MKRLFAMFAVFALASILAAYVALAPSAPSDPGLLHSLLSPLDHAASALVTLRGRDVAVMGVLGMGIVLALIAGIAVRERDPDAPSFRTLRRKAREDDLDEADPTPAWRPEPLSQEDRIASLRRRAEAAGDTFEDRHSQTDGDVIAGPVTPPVVLLRKPRERGRDWFGDPSWLGGLPRLGDTAWPRDAAGTPLPFAAQIDLADIAEASAHGAHGPHGPLPHEGSLAFFLGTGAVIAVPSDLHDFSEPPHDLPPAFDEGGQPFPARTSPLSRHFFPFWPVEPVTLAVPDDLSARTGPDREAAILRALAARMPALVEVRQRPFRAEDGTTEESPLWWHSVTHLADRMSAALEDSHRPLALRREALDRQRQRIADLLVDSATPPEAIDTARAEGQAIEVDLLRLERQREALPQMVQALDAFAAERPSWSRLSDEERALVTEILGEVSANYGELTREHVPATLEALATVSLRAMVSGPPDAFAKVPEEALERINRQHRLATRAQHRVLGPGAANGSLVLLQLGADDLMEWRWDESKVFRFRIAADDAQAGNWSAATLSFEDI